MVGPKTSRGLGGAREAISDRAMSQRFLDDASLISLVVSRSKTTVPPSLPRNSLLYLRRLTLFYWECNFRRDLPGMLREEGETDRTTD